MNGITRPVFAVLLITLLAAVAPALGQREVSIGGDRLSGMVLPVLPQDGDITIRALRGDAWSVDDTRRLSLSGDVKISVGPYAFRAATAEVWMNRLPSAEGTITQIAVFFTELRNTGQSAGMSASGEDLLITASARGRVSLQTSLLNPERPRMTSARRNAERRLAQYLNRLNSDPPALADQPTRESPETAAAFTPTPGIDPGSVVLPSPTTTRPWLRAPGAVLNFSADEIKVTTTPDTGAGEENVITAIGSLFVEYFSDDPEARLTQLTLTAERAVIFANPGTLEDLTQRNIDVSEVRGIYLEGNVTATAENGEQQVRAPRMYYDFTSDRAIMLDAVLRTYTRDSRIPVYARAREMQQIASNQWTATDVRVAASEYHVGHLSLGADRMLLSQRPGGVSDPDRGIAPTSNETWLEADAITMRIGNLPIFYWPGFAGTIKNIPLRGASVGSRKNDGLRFESTWGLFPLLGIQAPEGVDATLQTEMTTKRGGGLGVVFDYDVAYGHGTVDLYGFLDTGTDRTSSGRDVDRDDGLRGVALFEHQWGLARYWTLQAQGAWISDESFITSFREDDFRQRREYETSLNVGYRRGGKSFSLLTKYSVNDFISNDWLLASTQYSVDRAPEVTWREFGTPFFSDDATYSGETRIGRLRIAMETSTPRELGVKNNAFPSGPDVPLDVALRAQGIGSNWIYRADSRHEISVPTQVGPVQVTPFMAGRITAYDNDFQEFSSESDDVRLWGSFGVRMVTQFQYIDNTVESRAFDLHRLRHIIEPSLALWYAGANISEDDLPVYDPEVESLGTGATLALGLRNTWQTQRGGPGHWRSVDVLRIDGELVLNSGDTNRESPVPQYFAYRPEYSQFGDHANVSGTWLPSDTLSFTGTATYDIDESTLARGSIGTELRHTPLLLTYVEFRYLDASETQLLDVSWAYRLTPKHRVSLSPQWDFKEGDFRAVRVQVTRSFPDFDFTLAVRHDQIKDDTSVGASIGLVDF